MHSYSSMLGVLGNETGHYIEVIEYKFRDLIRVLLENIRVDEVWYRETYKDVEEAIRNGTLSSAREHYIVSGYFEDRLPYKIIVNTAWYLEKNPDVADGIRFGKIASAEEHFQMAGFKEGRLPFAGWSLLGLRN